jgi:hypothetical protein
VHAPSEEKRDDSNDRLFEELEQVFEHFPKNHMEIILRDFNAMLGAKTLQNRQFGMEPT